MNLTPETTSVAEATPAVGNNSMQEDNSAVIHIGDGSKSFRNILIQCITILLFFVVCGISMYADWIWGTQELGGLGAVFYMFPAIFLSLIGVGLSINQISKFRRSYYIVLALFSVVLFYNIEGVVMGHTVLPTFFKYREVAREVARYEKQDSEIFRSLYDQAQAALHSPNTIIDYSASEIILADGIIVEAEDFNMYGEGYGPDRVRVVLNHLIESKTSVELRLIPFEDFSNSKYLTSEHQVGDSVYGNYDTSIVPYKTYYVNQKRQESLNSSSNPALRIPVNVYLNGARLQPKTEE